MQTNTQKQETLRNKKHCEIGKNLMKENDSLETTVDWIFNCCFF